MGYLRKSTRRGSEILFKEEKGQSLVLILLILVIGAIVAFAIAARTIQDIRRTGQERVSDQAGAQVETLLDLVTTDQEWDNLVDSNQNFTHPDCTGNPTVCTLSMSALTSMFGGDLECDDATVWIRKETDIIGRPVNQDDVLEVNLEAAGSAGRFNISWTGQAKHLLVKVYYLNASNNVTLYEKTGTDPGPIAFTVLSPPPGDQWGTQVNNTVPQQVYYPNNALFARIRPINGDAEITVTNIPPQEMTVKSSCYISQVYREFVRVVPLYESVPAVFDYVLFDGNTQIDEFTP